MKCNSFTENDEAVGLTQEPDTYCLLSSAMTAGAIVETAKCMP